MQTRTIILALILATAGVASAAPETTGDDIHVTVTASRGRLGFAALEISPALRKHFGVPDDRGVLVDDVRAGSPAERAGLRVGDLVTTVDGDPIRSVSDVLAAISHRKRGETVALVIVRDRGELTLQAKLADDPGLAGRTGRTVRTLRDLPFEMQPMMRFGDRETRRALDDARRRIEELERRFEQLESQRTTP